VQSLDIIEIEPAMAAGAYAFHPRVDRLFRDRRAHVHFEDAKSYFARHGERYDVIVSEPSNPWVSGVASLFTAEFYRDTARYLAPGGLFVQWLHFYELDDRLLGSMFAAMDAAFADYDVYQVSAGDLVVVAVRAGRVPLPGGLPAAEAGFAGMLAQIGITRREHVLARRLGSKRQLAPLFAQFDPPMNSDYRPFVQLQAPRARYLQQRAEALIDLAAAPLPVLEMLAGFEPTYLSAPAPRAGPGRYTQLVDALLLQRALLGRDAPVLDPQALVLRQPGVLCASVPAESVVANLQGVALRTLAHLGPRERHALWVEPRWLGCPLERTAPRLREQFALFRAIAERDAPAMLQRARAALQESDATRPDWRRFLLLTAMLGAQASGQGEEARRLWRLHRGSASPTERYVAEWRN
jgi:hypothetical protein